VVVPLHNEQETVEELHRRVAAALADVRFELILVNDGSRTRPRRSSSASRSSTAASSGCRSRETSATRPRSRRGSTMPAATPS